MTLYDSKDNHCTLEFSSEDPVWSQLTGRIKSLKIDSLTPTVRLSLFNFYDWRFNPSKPARLTYVKDNTKTTLTIFPKILFKTESRSRPDDPTKPHYTTFTLCALG